MIGGVKQVRHCFPEDSHCRCVAAVYFRRYHLQSGLPKYLLLPKTRGCSVVWCQSALRVVIVETVPEVSVQSVTVVDGSSNDAATQVATFVEQLRHTTGIDLGNQMEQWFSTQPQSRTSQKKKMKRS